MSVPEDAATHRTPRKREPQVRGPQVRGLVTRQLILVAAGEQFAEHGFHGTTVSAVLVSAGATKGSMYFHFDNKEALAEAVIEQMVAGWHTVLTEVEGYRLDPLHTALAASDRVVVAMLEDPIARGGTRLLHDPALPSRAAGHHWAFGEAALGDQLRHAAAAGLLRPGLDPERIARSVIAQLTGHSVICDRAPDRPGLWDAVTDMWGTLLPTIATDEWLSAWARSDWPRRPRPHTTAVAGTVPDPADRMIQTVMMFERHLPPDRQDWFQRRRNDLGEIGWQAAVARWPGLIERVQAEIDDETDPADPRVQHLLTEWDQLVAVFLGEDPETRTAVVQGWRAVWNRHPEHLRDSAHVVSLEMRDYIEQARRSR